MPLKFISIEGMDGAGKTTAIGHIVDFFVRHNLAFIQTREPGGTTLGEKIRAILLDSANKIDARAELLLLYAARVQHIADVIAPALQQDRWVLCDRYIDATIAYQCFGRQLPLEEILLLNSMFVNDVIPYKTFYLDIPIELGKSRVQSRAEPDRFESESDLFSQRVERGYQQQMQQNPQRFIRIDASESEEGVREQILQQLQSIVAVM